ncbi:MAG: DUF3800 domain-containing protein [Planctomycetota bacterium]|nr:MAG: DUF3800 domain-containing protein [Planctomycetota bacterium]
MYLCYLDESGVPEQAQTSHFVFAGLAIPSHQWKAIDQRVVQIKRQFGLMDVELHAAWMARSYSEQGQVPNFDSLAPADRRKAVEALRARTLSQSRGGDRKKFRSLFQKTEGYIHLSRAERIEVLRQSADLIGGWSDIRLFAEAVNKDHSFGLTSAKRTPFEFAFTELVQRFEYFLRNRGAAIQQPLQGMLIQDNNDTLARKLTDLMRRFHHEGTAWTDIEHIIETPFFVDSTLTAMVQLADIVGYATRRFFENGETDLFDRIYGRFDRTPKGVVGIRHFTASTCDCRVCRDHA